jgi:acyl-CoA thioesterase
LIRENLEIVKDRFGEDKYAELLGVVLDEVTDATVRMHMRLREDMLNLYGRPHGGVIYSLADAAFSVLTNNDNNISVALECSITYHASPSPQAVLIVEGETLSKTRRTAAFLFKIFMEKDPAPVLIATMKSVSFRTGKPIEE